MARLRLYRDGRWVSTLPLEQETYTVGRAEDSALVLRSSSASRAHFSVGPNPKGEGYLLKDLESENGTFIDGVREYARVLKSRAIIQVGDDVILFEPSGQDQGKKTSDSLPFWAQKAMQSNPQLGQAAAQATQHIAPALQRRAQAERLTRLKPHLVALVGDARVFPLDAQLTTIGYGQARVSLGPDKKGTTVLAEIEKDGDDAYWIRAKGLFGKIKINGQSMAKGQLQAGAVIDIDKHRFRFELGLEVAG